MQVSPLNAAEQSYVNKLKSRQGPLDLQKKVEYQTKNQCCGSDPVLDPDPSDPHNFKSRGFVSGVQGTDSDPYPYIIKQK